MADLRGTGVWPKHLPQLTPAQEQVRDQFMARWLTVLPGRYSALEHFNQRYPLAWAVRGRTLEIGAGVGAHIAYEDLSEQEYHVVELRPELADAIAAKYPTVETVVADCQERMPFDDGFFDRVIGIHVLEHLTNLPATLDEVARLLRPGGVFTAVIPCERGMAYGLARRVSAQRLFEREFGMSYEWLIRSEHVNVPKEIVSELEKRFEIVDSRYFPLRIPSVHLNLVIGLTMRTTSA